MNALIVGAYIDLSGTREVIGELHDMKAERHPKKCD